MATYYFEQFAAFRGRNRFSMNRVGTVLVPLDQFIKTIKRTSLPILLSSSSVSNTTSVIAESPIAIPCSISIPTLPSYSVSIVITYLMIGTCTISNAIPGVVTCASHGLLDDDIVKFTTTGTLPSPLAVGTNYYVISAAENTFELSALEGGSPIDTTTDGSGVHTVYKKVA